MQPRIKSIKIKGYRPFRNFFAPFGPLEVIVGANGSGKSSLFEFLRFLRDSMSGEIPPEIIPGSVGQRIFHSPGPEKLLWEVEIDVPQDQLITYRGELMGPVGHPRVISESVWTVPGEILMEIRGENRLFMRISDSEGQEGPLGHSNQLALSTVNNPAVETLYNLREYIRDWRFYDSFRISRDKIRSPALVEQEPILQEDAGNLSSVLFYLMSIRPAFDELQQILRSTVPGFKELTVRARGAPGQVIAFWQEEGIEGELVLTDLSDGILQLICWAVLCVQPNPPSLICIDEPDQGVHPRTLAILAELFGETSERTQVLLATHSSYFLTLFNLSQIAVMRKEDGEAKFVKPADSKALVAILEDFGSEEIENLHISDELEILT
jgi:predicted ATPase